LGRNLHSTIAITPHNIMCHNALHPLNQACRFWVSVKTSVVQTQQREALSPNDESQQLRLNADKG
jgi:hypothetical protein